MSQQCPNCGAELGIALEVVAAPQTTKAYRRSARNRFGLTKREGEIADLIVDGLNNRQIATELRIGEQTVKNFNLKIFDKVGCSNRADLVRIVLLGADETK